MRIKPIESLSVGLDRKMKQDLLDLPIGAVKTYYYIGCGSMKGMATKVNAEHVIWHIPGTGSSQDVLVTIDACVERFGYH